MKQLKPPRKKTPVRSIGAGPSEIRWMGPSRSHGLQKIGLPPIGSRFSWLRSALSRLSPAEWRRRLLHMLPGLLPFVLWAVPHRDPLSWDCTAWLALVIVGMGLLTAYRYRDIARPEEAVQPSTILGYTVPILLMLLLFPGQPEIGLTVLAVLSIGDGSATLGGLLIRGPRLPWNAEKTWAGSLCFVFLAAPFASLIYWGEAHPSVSFESAMICGGMAALAAAVSESLSSRINDNIRVGVAAALSLVAMNALVVGWS